MGRKRPISFEPTIASVIREDWRADYNDYGTIEGRLETIQETYGTLQFYIRDAMLRQRVRCYFPEKLLPEVFDKFRKRVEVSGIIHYRKNGTPVSIEAEQIVGLPDDADLPTAEDVRGILDAGVAALETFDAELLKKTGIIGNPTLILRKPIPPAQKGLFDG